MNEPLLNAILQKIAFKGDEVRRFQAAVLYCALELHPNEMAADDIPLPLRPPNPTISGCVFALMKSDGLKIFNREGRRASRTKSRNAAWINTYRLTSIKLAKKWLEANGFPPVSVPHDVRAGQLLLDSKIR